MSWLFNSNNSHSDFNSSPPYSHGGSAVKDDLSILFNGVANLLAPPPPPSSSSVADSLPLSSSQTLTGIKNDLVEIGGSLKSSLSLLSANKAVTGISKFASQLLQFDGDHRQVDAVPGITEEVVRFVKDISTHPEYWTQFPLPLRNVDFSMSNSQREHALTMEQLVPEFVALRLNLCSYMNVEKFWIIYFLLILPRLNQHQFELLSTPKIVEARDMLLLKLGERKHLQAEECEKPRTMDRYEESREESERESISSEQNHILTDITKAVKGLEVDDMSGTEKWLEDTDTDAASLISCSKLQQEEDVSFSDLDDDGIYSFDRLSSGFREAQDKRGSSPDGSSDWVQLHESSEKGGRQKANLKGKDSEDESNDWFTVDEFN
ncbi:putative BSD domain-containing protein [Lupinus albus]|uniref:Putative BSD domain-containing protein n=1 Tax=Lupinus albus TaxID=3870 RepID=A0A6A4PJZ7_LUPAL|nr:putative BSD domain-containing protein [Lupinus albus]